MENNIKLKKALIFIGFSLITAALSSCIFFIVAMIKKIISTF